jgi:hypothetical protein
MEHIMNPDVLLDIEKEQVILRVLNSGSETKLTFSDSTKPTLCITGKTVGWDELKNEIDKTNKQREKHRQNRSRQTNGMGGEWDEPEGKPNDVDYCYDVHILEMESAVKISIINSEGPLHCFYIVPYIECKKT